MMQFYRLRKFNADDAAALHEALKNEKVIRHMASNGITFEDCKKIISEANIHWQKYNIGSWAIIDDASNNLIGWAGFKQIVDSEFELLIVLSPQYWGVGKEVAKDLIEKAKHEYALDKLYILLPETRKSFRFIQKLGFTFCKKIEYSGEPFLKFVKLLNSI